MTDQSRMRCETLADKVMSAEAAAGFIRPGDNVGMSGFTGAGYPKAVPGALVDRVKAATARGERFSMGVWTGASTAPELDGAVVEVAGITEDGSLIPSSSVGNNKTWLDQADRVILEVNSWQPAELEGMHDIYYGTALPPHRKPLQIVEPSDRIGIPYLQCPPEKIVAIVPTHAPDRNSAFKAMDSDSQLIASNVLESLTHEVKQGRLPATLLPLQSGVGNVANAVMDGLDAGPFRPLTAYTEVIQDGTLKLLRSGTLSMVSATAFSLSDEGLEDLRANIADYRDRIILRPQEISNHPEVIRRLGCLAMNGMIEADIYGNVNSTHLMGSSIVNGIGGSGDFTRNAFISMFLSPSTAKGGTISCIVPMASHVDHTEHDTHVIVTEQGMADLRGLPPRRRAKQIIEHCAHPDYRPALLDYLDRATASSGKHTPHLLGEALSWHVRYVQTGSMQQVCLDIAKAPTPWGVGALARSSRAPQLRRESAGSRGSR